MNTIILNQIFDTSKDLTDAGTCLYDRIKAQINSNDKAIIDMAGVTSMSSVFMNVSIGRIIDEYGMDVLKKAISFSNITQQQAKRLTEYLERYSNI
ncbi:MAG: STAS-like domain-containing protein [Paramuribaculum sp.]|nr:STAS-like domain-containing protein [Paramuribaculum sp.]